MNYRLKIILIILGTISLLSTGLADSETCEICHDDPDLQSVERGIPRSLYVNQDMLEHSVHTGFSCTDCHSSLEGFEDFPHPAKLPGVDCSQCHSDVFDIFMTGFYDHLAQKGFTGIPGCVQCHGTHEITNEADTKKVCGICHNEQRRLFEQSVHGNLHGDQQVNCTSCHSAHDKNERGQLLPKDWREFTVQRCLECHEDHSKNYLDSQHYKAVLDGNEKAPICTDCHSTHEIYAISDPRSTVFIDRLDQTCDRCHPGHESTIHRKSSVDPRLMTCVACHTGHNTDMQRGESKIFKETIPKTCNRCHEDELHQRENLAHGQIMVVDTEGNGANCTECHIYHYRISDDDHLLAARQKLQCTNCHAQETKDYERSAHGIAWRKGHKEAPTCVTCHGDRNVERISSRFSGQTIISLCSSCHANREVTMRFQLNPSVVEGYLNTYHGQVYSLGYQGEEFATCVSCHDNHLILASDNPNSTIARANLNKTCGRCHENTNENFVSALQHYDPMAPAPHPILHSIHTFIVWLLRITLSVFGIHTILWLIRAIVDRIKHGKRKRPKVHYRIKRFSKFERFLHAIVIISFLMLAMTGLPLKYSHTETSYWIASNLLDLRTMAIIHRIGAVLTFTYFALHLSSLFLKILKKKISLRNLLWGPDSLMLQPVDFKEFIQHIGWFLGIAKKPQFGRFSYWEKFDYLAVFWGVSVIGASGLTLWFPTFFTRLLPGWALNAAHIIHSEEALLATGFIFTIHFFNEHLRPENFPFDEVIFTGSMSEHYLQNERGRWYQRLNESNEFEKLKVKPMPFFPRLMVYLFGFAALAVGLALLTLILLGTIS